MASKLVSQVLHHEEGERGTTTSIVGTPGTGKTSLLYFLAQASVCREDGGDWEPETVMIRGRPLDLWFSLLHPEYDYYGGTVPEKPIKVFFHVMDAPLFHDSKNRIRFDKSLLGYYSNVPDLLKKIVRGGINIVYEPRGFKVTDAVQRRILQKSFLKSSVFENVDQHDPTIFWFEVFAYLISRGDREYMTVIIDEADDVLPSDPSSLRWHLQNWMRETVRDLRKCKISLVFAAHNKDDVDYRIFKKCMYRIWMPGAMVSKDSLIPLDHTIWLPKGVFTIVHGQYGDATFPKIVPYKQITVAFLNDDFHRQWHEEEEAAEQMANILPKKEEDKID